MRILVPILILLASIARAETGGGNMPAGFGDIVYLPINARDMDQSQDNQTPFAVAKTYTRFICRLDHPPGTGESVRCTVQMGACNTILSDSSLELSVLITDSDRIGVDTGSLTVNQDACAHIKVTYSSGAALSTPSYGLY